jgi:NTE family protein
LVPDRPGQIAASVVPPEGTLVVNGVFKGGGAKGIVYAGALKAVHAREIRFSSVAGSSAGAITATLIAAKLTVEEINDETKNALRAIRGSSPYGLGQVVLGFIPFVEKTLFSVGKLERWLEGVLARQMTTAAGHSQSEPVSFRQLHNATQIELYVVALDLATREPIVFHRKTTPECSVAQAVLASSAIPLVMPPGRVTVAASGEAARVHRLVDGGAWANYPAFVFRDSSFRIYEGLDDVPMSAHTLGFVIDKRLVPADQRPSVVQLQSRRRSSHDMGSGARANTIGALLNWPALRAVMVLGLPFVFGLVLFDWLQSNTVRYFDFLHRVPGELQPLTLILFVSAVAMVFTTTIAFSLLLYRFGREMFDVGFPAMLASLSVGPRVPDWVGADSGVDPVIRLQPPPGVGTLSFATPRADAAIADAEADAGEQLNELLPSRAQPVPLGRVASPAKSHDYSDTSVLAFFVLAGFIAAAVLTLSVVRRIAAHTLLGAFGYSALAAGCLLLICVFGAKRYARKAGGRPRHFPAWALVRLVIIVPAIVLVYFSGQFSWSLASETDFTRIPATVCCTDPQDRDYIEVRLARAIPGELNTSSGSSSIDYADDYCSRPQDESAKKYEAERGKCLDFVYGLIRKLHLHYGDRTTALFQNQTYRVLLGGDEWSNNEVLGIFGLTGSLLVLVVLVVWAVIDLWQFASGRSAARGRGAL